MVGQRVYQHVVVTCAPRAPLCHHAFQALPLPLGTRFALVSAGRDVAPEQSLCLTVSFQPNAARASTTVTSQVFRLSLQADPSTAAGRLAFYGP